MHRVAVLIGRTEDDDVVDVHQHVSACAVGVREVEGGWVSS